MTGSRAMIDASIFTPAAKRLTPKQMKFIEAYALGGGNGTAAAILAGYAESAASGAAARMLRNPLIQQEIMKQTLQVIGLAAVPALATVKRLSVTARSEYVQLEASKDLLDRAGFKAPDKAVVQLDAALSVRFDIAEGG